jgi:hypothetical protein
MLVAVLTVGGFESVGELPLEEFAEVPEALSALILA